MKKIFICFILFLSIFLTSCNNENIKKIDIDYDVYSSYMWSNECEGKNIVAKSTDEMYAFVYNYLNKNEEYYNLKNEYNNEFFNNYDLGIVVVSISDSAHKAIITDYNIENNIMNIKIKKIWNNDYTANDVMSVDVLFIKLDKKLNIKELTLSKSNNNPETFIEQWINDKNARLELLKWFRNNYDLDNFTMKQTNYYFGNPDYSNSSFNEPKKYYYLLGDNEFINENDILYFEFDLTGKQIQNKIIKKEPISIPKNIDIKNLGYDTTTFSLDKEYKKISNILKNVHLGYIDKSHIYDLNYDFYIETIVDKKSRMYFIDLDKKIIYRDDASSSSLRSIVLGQLSEKDVNYFKDILDGIIPSLDNKIYLLENVLPALQTINPDKIKIESTYSGINPASLVKIKNYTTKNSIVRLLYAIRNFNLRRIRKDHILPPGYSEINFIFLNNEKDILRFSICDNIIFINNTAYKYSIEKWESSHSDRLTYDYLTYRFVRNITNFKTKTVDGTVLEEYKTGLEGLEFEEVNKNIGYCEGAIESDFLCFQVYSGNVIKIGDKYYRCINKSVVSYFNNSGV